MLFGFGRFRLTHLTHGHSMTQRIRAVHLATVINVTIMLIFVTTASAAGVMGEQRTLDIQISGSTTSSVVVNECEVWRWRDTDLSPEKCQVIGTCSVTCSIPVQDSGTVQVLNAWGGLVTRPINRSIYLVTNPAPGFGVSRLGSTSTGMRHARCRTVVKLSSDPSTCVLRLNNTSLVDPFEIEFRPADRLTDSTRDVVKPLSQTASINTVRLSVGISRLFEPRLKAITTECVSATGGSESSTTLRAPFGGRNNSASFRLTTIRIRNLTAGTTYHCTMSVRPAALVGAKSIRFSIGTTGGSGSGGGGSSGGSGSGSGGSTPGAKPIGAIGL